MAYLASQPATAPPPTLPPSIQDTSPASSTAAFVIPSTGLVTPPLPPTTTSPEIAEMLRLIHDQYSVISSLPPQPNPNIRFRITTLRLQASRVLQRDFQTEPGQGTAAPGQRTAAPGRSARTIISSLFRRLRRRE